MARLRLPGGVEAVIRVRGEETGGAFTLLTDTAPPGWRLPPHSHRAESETIHVTAGRLWMTVDDVECELGPGDTIHIPSGVRHEGGTAGSEAGGAGRRLRTGRHGGAVRGTRRDRRSRDDARAGTGSRMGRSARDRPAWTGSGDRRPSAAARRRRAADAGRAGRLHPRAGPRGSRAVRDRAREHGRTRVRRGRRPRAVHDPVGLQAVRLRARACGPGPRRRSWIAWAPSRAARRSTRSAWTR